MKARILIVCLSIAGLILGTRSLPGMTIAAQLRSETADSVGIEIIDLQDSPDPSIAGATDRD